MWHISLLNTTSDNKQLTKTFTTIKECSCNLILPLDLIRPRITIKTFEGVHNVNYIYVQETQRYYFVNNKTLLNGGIVELHLSEDVLQSFNQQIKNVNGIVERQENIYNNYIVDNKLVPRVERFIESEKIGQVISGGNVPYSLTVNGG